MVVSLQSRLTERLNSMVANQTDATYGFLDIPEDLPNLNWRDLFLLKDSLKWDDFAREFRLWIKTQRAWPFLCFLDMALVRPNDLKDKERGVYFLVAPKCNIASYKQFMAGFLTAGYGIARSKEFLNGIFDFSYSSNLQFLTVDSEKGLNVGGGVFNSDLSCEISEVQFSSSEAKYSLKESIDAFMKVVSNGTFRDAYNRDISTVFFVPISTRVGTSKNLAQLVVGVSNCNVDDIIKELLQKVSQFVYYYYASAHAEQQAEQLKGAYTHAAIGSIMSRNGSHNIGSHVLSALSHNVGTMPDDRVLYQYIQHRMDYIATATTEFPQWTTPTMFVAGLMKNFYSQKHLLDYISRSEGLQAYKFQERNLDEAARMNQHGTIRIFIRKFFELGKVVGPKELPPDHRYLTYDLNDRAWSIYYFFGEKDKMFRQRFSDGKRTEYEVSESGGTAKFLEYDERFTPDWRQDVRVAIPGGIVGQHAFFTIIENIIRNAAKHGWAAEQNLCEKDLEIFVDFHEKEDKVVFTIGDNVSDVFGKEFWSDFFKRSDRRTFADGEEGDVEFLKSWKTLLDIFAEEIKAIQIDPQHGDGCQVIKKAYDELNKWSEGVADASDRLFSEKAVERLDDLLPRAFAAPLNTEDTGRIGAFLRENKGGLGGKGVVIPLVYCLQTILMSRFRNLVLQMFVNGRPFIDGMYRAWNQYCIDERQARLSRTCDTTKEAFLKHWHSYMSQPSEMRSTVSTIVNGFCVYLMEVENLSPVVPLHHKQQCKLAQSFIDSSGKLRKSNWGLAEMKISAGYLAQRNTEEIGGLSEKGNDILVPIAMPGVCRNADNPHNCLVCSRRNVRQCYNTDQDCPLKRHRFHLGYRFSIAKPRDVLVILDWQFPNAVDTKRQDLISVFGSEGIDFAYANIDVMRRVGSDGKEHMYIKCKCRRINSNGELESSPIEKFNYRYVIFPSEFPEKLRGEEEKVRMLFCFRGVASTEIIFQKESIGNIVRGITGDSVSLDELFKSCEVSKDHNTVNYSEEDVGNLKYVAVFRKAVQSAWVRKLARERFGAQYCGDKFPVKLIVNVEGGENRSERGLVSLADLLRTMFVECYHTALMSFLKNPPCQLSLGDTTKRLVTLLSLIKVMPEKMVPPQQDYGHGTDFGAKEFIRKQLVSYCNLLKSHLLLSAKFVDALESMEKYGQDLNGNDNAFIVRKIEDIEKNFERAMARRLVRGRRDEDPVVRERCDDLISWLQKTDKPDLDGFLDAFHGGSDEYNFPVRRNVDGTGCHSFDENLRAVVTACSVPEEDEFNALVESLNSMFLASDVYLRKYEERIATLPEAYKHDGGDKTTKADGGAYEIQDIADSLMGGESGEGDDCKTVKYSRHDHAMPEDGIYSEALSGSQSYLNSLSRLVCASGEDKTGERYAAVTRLLENAFLRILVIDERVMNFVRAHTSDEMIKTFINMGIYVADIERHGTPLAIETVKDCLYRFDFKKDAAVNMGNKQKSEFTNIPPGDFDLLVIHQGVIDKWWESHDELRVKEILDDLRSSIPRVVVTTGRGRPENIPPSEKVLPFSVVESSLFKRYPEKLILVNTIMNLLPYGEDV